MSRRSRPPLYEFISKSPRDQGTVAPPPSQRTPQEGPPPPATNVGQSIRLPVGYIFLAIAGMLLVAILTFALGAWRGRETAEKEFYDDYPGEALAAQDPLNAPPPTAGAGARPPVENPVQTSPSPARDRSTARPVGEDPRESGFSYFVLAETRPEGARRLAEFCQDRGLAAHVIRSDNPRFRRVICLPGLTTTSTSSPEYRDLKDEILRVGRLWKAQHPGEHDLSDAYLISEK